MREQGRRKLKGLRAERRDITADEVDLGNDSKGLL